MKLSKQAIANLEVGFSDMYAQGWRDSQPWWDRLAMEVPSKTKTNTYGWMKRLAKMREWIGPRTIQNLDTHAFTVENKSFELTVGVDRDDIDDDNLGIYNPLFKEMGRSARKLPDQQVKLALQAGTTGLGFDGVAMFASTHPLNPAGNQSNNFTTTALSGTNFATVRAAMQAYTGEDGEPLGVNPDLLIVPPQLGDTANTILTAAYGASGATNIQQGQAKVLIVPELANQGTTWYLADTSAAIKALVWQKRREVEMVSMTDVTTQNVFMHKQFLWGVDGRGVATYGPWFLMARAIA